MGSATSTYTVQFWQSPKRESRTETPGRVPRVARLLALAHSIDARIRSGQLSDLAHAASVMGLTRARVTQISGLLLLAPPIQEEILALPPVTKGRDPISERSLRPIMAEPEWNRQYELWDALRCGLPRLAVRRSL